MARPIDIQLIGIMMIRHTDEELASYTGVPMDEVRVIVRDLSAKNGRKSKSQLTRKKQLGKVDKETVKKVRSIAKQRVLAVPKRTPVKVFEMKQIDLAEKVRVIIDRKTSIYINAGQDPEKARVDFLKRQKK